MLIVVIAEVPVRTLIYGWGQQEWRLGSRWTWWLMGCGEAGKEESSKGPWFLACTLWCHWNLGGRQEKMRSFLYLLDLRTTWLRISSWRLDMWDWGGTERPMFKGVIEAWVPMRLSGREDQVRRCSWASVIRPEGTALKRACEKEAAAAEPDHRSYGWKGRTISDGKEWMTISSVGSHPWSPFLKVHIPLLSLAALIFLLPPPIYCPPAPI